MHPVKAHTDHKTVINAIEIDLIIFKQRECKYGSLIFSIFIEPELSFYKEFYVILGEF